MVNDFVAPCRVPVGRFTFPLADRVRDFVDADSARGEGAGIELGADRVLLGAEDLHLGHAAYHGNALGHRGLGVFVHGCERQRGRTEREIDDRLVRGIDLLVGRGRRHVRREQARGLGDHGLDVLGRGIDVPAEVELKVDLGGAERAHRRHVVEAGDGGKLALERRCHGRGHRLRTGAGQRGVHDDVREIHIRQIAHGQQTVRHDAEEKDRAHDQGRHDRSSYKGFCDIHRIFLDDGVKSRLLPRRRGGREDNH